MLFYEVVKKKTKHWNTWSDIWWHFFDLRWMFRIQQSICKIFIIQICCSNDWHSSRVWLFSHTFHFKCKAKTFPLKYGPLPCKRIHFWTKLNYELQIFYSKLFLFDIFHFNWLKWKIDHRNRFTKIFVDSVSKHDFFIELALWVWNINRISTSITFASYALLLWKSAHFSKRIFSDTQDFSIT